MPEGLTHRAAKAALRLAGGSLAAALMLCSAGAHADDGDPGLTGLWTLDQKEFDKAVDAKLPYSPAGHKIADAQHQAVAVKLQVLGKHEARCLPIGMPAFMANEFALEILQTPGRVTLLSEASSLPRTVYLDRTAPSKGLEPMWNGYSVGHWEGNTLVIHTDHMNDRVSPITMGGVHSPTTVITERLHLEAGGQTLVNETTFEDSRYLAQPYTTVHHYQRLAKDAELWEYACEIEAPGWSERYAGEKPGLSQDKSKAASGAKP